MISSEAQTSYQVIPGHLVDQTTSPWQQGHDINLFNPDLINVILVFLLTQILLTLV